MLMKQMHYNLLTFGDYWSYIFRSSIFQSCIFSAPRWYFRAFTKRHCIQFNNVIHL